MTKAQFFSLVAATFPAFRAGRAVSSVAERAELVKGSVKAAFQ